MSEVIQKNPMAMGKEMDTLASNCMLSNGDSVEDRLNDNYKASATYEEITGTDYVAPSDGYLVVGCITGTGNYCQATADEVVTAYVYGVSTGYNAYSVYVKKGMTLKKIGGGGTNWARFYPIESY